MYDIYEISFLLHMYSNYLPLSYIPMKTQNLIQNTTHVNCKLLHGAKVHLVFYAFLKTLNLLFTL